MPARKQPAHMMVTLKTSLETVVTPETYEKLLPLLDEVNHLHARLMLDAKRFEVQAAELARARMTTIVDGHVVELLRDDNQN